MSLCTPRCLCDAQCASNITGQISEIGGDGYVSELVECTVEEDGRERGANTVLSSPAR